MGEISYKVYFLLALILVDLSSSYDSHLTDNNYDESIWSHSRNYIEEDEDNKRRDKDEQERIDIKMPDVSPEKVQYANVQYYQLFPAVYKIGLKCTAFEYMEMKMYVSVLGQH